jgi:sulfoxide reductase heme-binding subunit YedZ
MVAWLLLVPLAATSFDRAIRWMGGKRWQRLHRLVYLAATAAVVHYAWQGKGITNRNLYYAAILLVLLLSRVAFWSWKQVGVQHRLKPLPRG